MDIATLGGNLQETSSNNADNVEDFSVGGGSADCRSSLFCWGDALGQRQRDQDPKQTGDANMII
jgi:hypothetical protein